MKDFADQPNVYRQDLKDYLTCHCSSPRKMWCYDAHMGCQRLMTIPCGVCYHCRETKKNEWVTRCYAHTKDFKNVYFVTLTYTSIRPDVKEGSVQWLIRDYLRDALWTLDDHNQNKTLCWSPCVVCQDHFQKFMMRLRKNTGFTDITYVASYEYGKRFARPHAHFILFTNNDLTKADIQRAWSLLVCRDGKGNIVKKTSQKTKGHLASFGNVDFHCLTTNGTFNEEQKIKVDGNYLSAAHCFKYVCKYVLKNDPSQKLQKYDTYFNCSRVDFAYDNLYFGNNSQEAWHFRQHKNPNKVREYNYQFHRVINRDTSYALDCEELKPEFQLSSSNIYLNKINFYEKITFGTSSESPYSGFKLASDEISNGRYKFTFECSKEAFRMQFRPLFRVSRGTPIGSVYAETHVDEFSEGVFRNPCPKDVSFVVPAYFRRKAAEFLYGLRLTHETNSGCSLAKDCLPLVSWDLLQGSQGSYPKFLPVHSSELSKTDSNYLEKVLRSHFCLRDGEHRYVICHDSAGLFVQHFKYHAHKRQFYLVCNIDFCEFCKTYYKRLLRSYKKHDELVKLAEDNDRCWQEVLRLIDEKSGTDFARLRDSIEADFIFDLEERQRLYDETHKDPLDT